MKVSVVGGGSSYTPELVSGLMDVSKDIGLEELWLFDIEEGRRKLETIYEFSRRFVKDRFEIHMTFNISEALSGADYVVFQFRPGGLDGRLKDETIPLKYGLIGQETTGMGGFAAALRVFPEIEKYVNYVERYSKATVVNFTNPSGHITEFVLNYLNFKRFIGLCNIPINLARAIADFFSVTMDEVFLKYYGLNHLTFLERVYVRNEDVTGRILKALEYSPENVPSYGFPNWFIEAIGLFPNPYLKYYLMEEKVLEKLKSSKPRAREVMEIEKELFEKYRTFKKIPEELSKRGGSMYSTAAANLIRDLQLSSKKVHIVNTVNAGAVENLPGDYVLEIPTVTIGGGVSPVSLGNADYFTLSLIHPVKMYERLTIEGYLKRSKKKLLKAILAHPLGPDVGKARELLDDIISANGLRDYS